MANRLFQNQASLFKIILKNLPGNINTVPALYHAGSAVFPAVRRMLVGAEAQRLTVKIGQFPAAKLPAAPQLNIFPLRIENVGGLLHILRCKKGMKIGWAKTAYPLIADAEIERKIRLIFPKAGFSGRQYLTALLDKTIQLIFERSRNCNNVR